MVKREEILYLKFTDVPFTGEYQYLNDENKALCITKCKDGHAISSITYYENGQLMSKHTYMKKFGNSRFYENGSLMYESKETPELSSIGYERSFNSDSSIEQESIFYNFSVKEIPGWKFLEEQKKYFKNGNMEEEVNFIYMDLNRADVSRKHGERIIYFENGNIRIKFFYWYGKEVRKIEYDKNSKIISKTRSLGPMQKGWWDETIEEDGRLKVKGYPSVKYSYDEKGNIRYKYKTDADRNTESIFYKDGVITSRTIDKRLRLNDGEWKFYQEHHDYYEGKVKKIEKGYMKSGDFIVEETWEE